MTGVALWSKDSFFREIQRELKISCRRKSQLVVSYQVVTDPCCGLSVIFCGFISHLIGRETINIPEIFSSVHGFVGTTVKLNLRALFREYIKSLIKITPAFI